MSTHVLHEYYGLDVTEKSAILTAYFNTLIVGDLINIQGMLWEVLYFEQYSNYNNMYIVQLAKV